MPAAVRGLVRAHGAAVNGPRERSGQQQPRGVRRTSSVPRADVPVHMTSCLDSSSSMANCRPLLLRLRLRPAEARVPRG